MWSPLGPRDLYPRHGSRHAQRAYPRPLASKRRFLLCLVGPHLASSDLTLAKASLTRAASALGAMLTDNLSTKDTRSASTLWFMQPSDGGASGDLYSGLGQLLYRQLLTQSVFTLCPGDSEWLADDTHCVWEAIEAHSIPVVRDDASWRAVLGPVHGFCGRDRRSFARRETLLVRGGALARLHTPRGFAAVCVVCAQQVPHATLHW